jgi:hypothetical protein
MWSDKAQSMRDFSNTFGLDDGYQRMAENARATFRKEFNENMQKGLALLPAATMAGGVLRISTRLMLNRRNYGITPIAAFARAWVNAHTMVWGSVGPSSHVCMGIHPRVSGMSCSHLAFSACPQHPFSTPL